MLGAWLYSNYYYTTIRLQMCVRVNNTHTLLDMFKSLEVHLYNVTMSESNQSVGGDYDRPDLSSESGLTGLYQFGHMYCLFISLFSFHSPLVFHIAPSLFPIPLSSPSPSIGSITSPPSSPPSLATHLVLDGRSPQVQSSHVFPHRFRPEKKQKQQQQRKPITILPTDEGNTTSKRIRRKDSISHYLFYIATSTFIPLSLLLIVHFAFS